MIGLAEQSSWHRQHWYKKRFSPVRCIIRMNPKDPRSLKKDKKSSGKPPFQVHHQKTDHDRRLTGLRELCHDPV